MKRVQWNYPKSKYDSKESDVVIGQYEDKGVKIQVIKPAWAGGTLKG